MNFDTEYYMNILAKIPIKGPLKALGHGKN